MAASTGSLLHSAERPSAPRRGLWRNHPALMVALTYGVIGIIYIALSDQIVSFLMQHDEDRVTAIQTWKGWAWIVLTTFLILFLVQHSIKEVRAAQRETLDVDARYRTSLEQSLETQRLLLNELDHRVRNNLSSLSSLIDLSKEATGSVDEFASIMSGRIQAMAKAHALAARAGNDGQDLGRVVAEMIPLTARGRVSIEGARLGVASGQIVSFALLVHELASRSLRSGSLSRDDGRAVVSWSSADTNGSPGTVSLRWRETPAIDDSAASEHVDSLIAGFVQRDLRGAVTTRREDDAMVHELSLSLGNTHPTA